MATTKKAPAKKTAAKRAPARKSTAKRAAPRKAIAAKKPMPKLKQSAEKALNIYLGVIGKGIDTLQENIDSVRKDSDKYLQSYEKRGVQMRKKLSKRWDKLDDRLKVLAKKYPLVMGAVFVAGAVVGLIIGLLF